MGSQSKALQHEKMLLTNPSQLATVLLLLTGAMLEAKDLECCTEKRVGSVSYTLLPGTFHGELPSQCLNDCVYTVSGNSAQKFCFAKGDLPTECLSELSELSVIGCIVQGDTAYIGNDIVRKIVSGLKACADFCAETVGGKYWSFDRNTNLCYVKSSNNPAVASSHDVSGNVACGDQFRGCCSWRNITGSAEKDGFYILSESGNNVTDQCMDGCAYTKVNEDQEQHCLPTTSMDNVVTECNSCNECKGTDLVPNIVGGCGEFAGKILGFLATCTVKCLLSIDVGCIVGCITDLLVEGGLPAAAIDCVCQVIPGNLC